MAEWLLGSQGKNHTFGDVIGVELKWKGSLSTLLTLFHCEVNPNGYPSANGALVPLLREYGYTKREDGPTLFRHTISKKNREHKFEIDKIQVDSNQRIVLRSMGGYEVFWEENDLLNAAMKLRRLVLIHGECGVDEYHRRYISITSAVSFDKFRVNQFLNFVHSKDIQIDFDFREAVAGEILKPNPRLRNHGTKFRINSAKLPLLWEEIEVI